ncbi:CBS domain-containing protein [Psychrobacillus sp. L3]|uniref:CBS domain-containing protein n=1 Tax=Psychrobacillus sp. L3 TaxID=3236891 RepID=UPI0036F28BFC
MIIEKYIVTLNSTILEVIQQIEENKAGFVLVVEEKKLKGTLTDGDVRRALINLHKLSDNIDKIIQPNFEFLKVTDSFDTIVAKFKTNKIQYLPIVDEANKLINILTKEQLHVVLLEGKKLDLKMDFSQFDGHTLSHEIYNRPWGYYKTVFLSEYVQAKVIHVEPLQQLSLQYHRKREEHWVVVKGQGEMTIGESKRSLSAGSYIFIPKGCLHRIKNTSGLDSLVISEVQLGDYFGEDDIIRIEDDYGRE